MRIHRIQRSQLQRAASFHRNETNYDCCLLKRTIRQSRTFSDYRFSDYRSAAIELFTNESLQRFDSLLWVEEKINVNDEFSQGIRFLYKFRK